MRGGHLKEVPKLLLTLISLGKIVIGEVVAYKGWLPFYEDLGVIRYLTRSL